MDYPGNNPANGVNGQAPSGIARSLILIIGARWKEDGHPAQLNSARCANAAIRASTSATVTRGLR